jgi:hypothetical protein
MKRLALVLALVAVGACQKAEQKPAAQAPAADTSKGMAMPMADTSKHMMMADTAKHMMMADTAKKMTAPAKPAPQPTKKKP